MENNILKTLLYSDIFDYPLIKDELWHYLIANHKVSKKGFQASGIVSSQVANAEGYFFLKDRKLLVNKRKRREKESLKKILRAQSIARVLMVVPTVMFIGISGTVAMQNAEKKDDIDFFVITKEKSIWITRLLLLIILQIMGVRRKKGESHHLNNKICLNFLVDTSQLITPLDRQDIYTAHEIVQLMPLITRGNIYQEFLKQNAWVTFYLPNALSFAKKRQFKQKGEGSISIVLTVALQLIEPFARWLQERYMKHHKTSEIVTHSVLAFHPYDYRKKVLTMYNVRLKRHRLVTRGY